MLKLCTVSYRSPFFDPFYAVNAIIEATTRVPIRSIITYSSLPLYKDTLQKSIDLIRINFIIPINGWFVDYLCRKKR